jgi:hypothetical protein
MLNKTAKLIRRSLTRTLKKTKRMLGKCKKTLKQIPAGLDIILSKSLRSGKRR